MISILLAASVGLNIFLFTKLYSQSAFDEQEDAIEAEATDSMELEPTTGERWQQRGHPLYP